MATYVLYGLFILSCIVLVIAVLLQPGKADAGALFSSSVSSTAFGPRGTQTILAKVTIGAAISFMLIALLLSLPALTGTRSVLQSQPEEPTATPQASPAASVAPTVTASPAQEGTSSNANANANTGAAPNANAQASPAQKK
ncbi:MAG: preprotein translocase subunit SecG [Pyrinomonadaceae bacterium]